MQSLYNEDRYLNNDIESLEYFEERRKKYQLDLITSLEKNREVIKLYDTYLDCIVEELLKYNITNPLSYSLALGYIIKNGILSDDFFEPKETDDEIIGKLGISIVLGKGCCRNVCDMHQDIFKRLNIDTIPFYCNYEKFIFTNNLNKNKPANHIINLINYNNNLYGIDIYNDCILYGFKNPFIMESISSNFYSLLRYKPYYELIMDNRTIRDVNERVLTFADYSLKKKISHYVYELDLRYEVEKLLMSKRYKLVEFNYKTKPLRREIINKLKH